MSQLQIGLPSTRKRLKCTLSGAIRYAIRSCSKTISKEQDSITAAHALHVTWIPDAGRRKRKESCLSKRIKIATFSYCRKKGNGLARQLCVLARFPANFSSLGVRQTKQRLSRWCGIALRMSMATRSHRIPHEKFKLFTVDFEWVVAISVNKLLGSSRAKLQKNLPKQSPTVLVRARAIKAPLDRLISAIVVASCCRLSLECRQNRPKWR